MRSVRFSGLIFIVGGTLLGGCTQLVPGLNVRKVEVGEHALSAPVTVKSDPEQKSEWPPYGPTRVPPLPGAVAAKPDPNAGADTEVLQKYRVVKVTPDVVSKLLDDSGDVDANETAQLPTVTPSDVPPEYVIGAGDVLFMTIWEHRELTDSIAGVSRDPTDEGRIVAADGTTYFPYIGTFKVAGMTVADVRSFMAGKLGSLIVNPKIDVRVIGYRAHRIQVTGEIKKPGTLTLDDTPKGVLQALDASGGLTDLASTRRAVLVRGGTPYRIDLAALLSGEGPARNPRLEAGDELHFPSRDGDRVYVLGEVARQRPIEINRDRLPLIAALTEAGGLDKLSADDSGVLVFRLNEPGAAIAASIYVLDMSSPEGLLMASQFPLRVRDVVYVQATGLSQYNNVVQQILPTMQTLFNAARVGEIASGRRVIRER